MRRAIRKIFERSWWENQEGRTTQVFLVVTLVTTTTGVVLVLRRRRKHLNNVLDEDVVEVPVATGNRALTFLRGLRALLRVLQEGEGIPDMEELASRIQGGGKEPPA